jgi:hypothetical protein
VLINVSAEVTKALERLLEESENPQVARKIAIVDRLRKALEHRRGPDYQAGFHDGERWAAEDGSWREVRTFAAYSDDDVQVEEVAGQWNFIDLVFRGSFRAPAEDYGRYLPEDEHSSARYGAPAFGIRLNLDPEPTWVTYPFRCETYWRGWLGGVRAVYDLVVAEIAPDTVESGDPDFAQGDWVNHPAFGVGQILKATPTKNDVELVVKFERAGLKILSGRLAPLERLEPSAVEGLRLSHAAQDQRLADKPVIDPDDIPF